MPEIIPYHLTFHGGLHVGSRGVDVDEARPTLPADTLFSALVSAWVQTGRDADAWVQPFVGDAPDPPFLLTSAFPFAGDVRFYPAPVDMPQRFSKATVKRRGKAIKRIAWISEALFHAYLAGEPLDDRLFPDDAHAEPSGKQGAALQGGTLWLTQEEAARLPQSMRQKPGAPVNRPLRALRQLRVFAMERVPRVAIDRVSDASNIFHAGRTTFARGCGLWFGVQWLHPDAKTDDLTYRQAFELLLAHLADSGLGGERTYGYGAFTFAPQSAVPLPEPQPQAPAMLLSRYHPRQDELPAVLGNGAAYRLESVAGWLYSPDGPGQRRKRLHLLGEGSLAIWPGHPAGDVTDVRPEYEEAPQPFPHPVWRYGLALAAGVQKEVTDA